MKLTGLLPRPPRIRLCVPKKRNESLVCSLPIVGKAALELFWELGYTVPKGLCLVAPCKLVRYVKEWPRIANQVQNMIDCDRINS